MAAKSGRVGAGAARDPGFQPGGRVRGTHCEYRFDQVPSAMTASNPEFSASTNGLLSLATAYATNPSLLKVCATTTAGSPRRIVLAASPAGATHASIWRVLRLAYTVAKSGYFTGCKCKSSTT